MKLIYHAQLHEGHAILINFDTPEDMEAFRVGFGFDQAICHSFWPSASTIYIHIRLITVRPFRSSSDFSPLSTESCSGILFNAFKYMNYAHCTLAQTSLVVVRVCVCFCVPLLPRSFAFLSPFLFAKTQRQLIFPTHESQKSV